MKSPVAPELWLRILLSRWTWPVALFGLTLLFLPFHHFGRLESGCLDLGLRLRLMLGLTEPMPREILLLEIDDDDLTGLGTVASEYMANAKAIRQASGLGARVIAVDAIFQRGSRQEAQPILDAIEAARKQGTAVVMAEVLDHLPPEPNGAVKSAPLHIERSFPFLEKGLQPSGLANADPDRDGVFRRYQLVRTDDGESWPSLALAAHLAALPPGVSVDFPSPGTARWIELAPDFVTQIEDAANAEELWLNFREPWASDVLDRAMDPPMRRHWNLRDLDEFAGSGASTKPFAGKTVFLGYVAEGAADRGPTPFGPREPKMMIHAQALSDLLTSAPLRRAPFHMPAFLASVVLLFCFTHRLRRNIWLVLLFLGVLAGLLTTAFLVFHHWHLLVPTALLIAVWTAAFALELLRRVKSEDLERCELLATIEDEASDESASGPESPAYWAFISYSSKDRKFVRRFHRALERYSIPAWLVGRHTDKGMHVPPKLFPMFRDRDELRGSADLAKQLTTALERSRSLIVVCSSASAESKWVNEEVLHFKRLGRGDRITCVIPDSEKVDPPECFCDALMHRIGDDGELEDDMTEPLAADARSWRDGLTNAKLKVIAGTLGIPFDDLRQREILRKEKRLGIIAATVVALLAATVLLSLKTARRNRDEIQRREDAEAVIQRIERDLQNLKDAPDRPQTLEDSLERIRRYHQNSLPDRAPPR